MPRASRPAPCLARHGPGQTSCWRLPRPPTHPAVRTVLRGGHAPGSVVRLLLSAHPHSRCLDDLLYLGSVTCSLGSSCPSVPSSPCPSSLFSASECLCFSRRGLLCPCRITRTPVLPEAVAPRLLLPFRTSSLRAKSGAGKLRRDWTSWFGYSRAWPARSPGVWPSVCRAAEFSSCDGDCAACRATFISTVGTFQKPAGLRHTSSWNGCRASRTPGAFLSPQTWCPTCGEPHRFPHSRTARTSYGFSCFT